MTGEYESDMDRLQAALEKEKELKWVVETTVRYYCGAILLDLRVGTLLEEDEEEEDSGLR